ncbi:hypothetical protein [Lysinibacillus sp. TE18511]
MFSVAKAQRQLQMFSVRKRSVSNNYVKVKWINVAVSQLLYQDNQ